MKEKDLITAFSEITADESAKNEIERKIFIKQKEKKPTFFKRPLIAVVATVCVFVCSLPVVAEPATMLLTLQVCLQSAFILPRCMIKPS